MVLKNTTAIFLGIVSCTLLYLVILSHTNHLNQDTTITDWLSVIAYFLTLFAAISAAVFAWKANQINKGLFEREIEPVVEFTLFFLPNFFGIVTLKLKNSSKNIARNLKFDFEIIHEDPFNNAHSMIKQLQFAEFTHVGLNSLSSLESRYLGYINTRNLSIDDGYAQIKVNVHYEDIHGKLFINYYVLNLEELKGITKIGKSFDEQIVEELRNIVGNFSSLNTTQKGFIYEYEKTHREWTEAEFRQKVEYFDKTRNILRVLNQPEPDSLVDKRVSRRESIHKIRKQNK